MGQQQQINKNIAVITINKDLDANIINLCNKSQMDKEFFITKALENHVIMISQNPRLMKKVNDYCEKYDMSKIFFYTKALEYYCKHLDEKNKEE
jgi:hypothetical protein